MNLPAALDVAIGLIVLYFLLSTICSFVVEMLAVFFWWRKILLYRTIGRLLTNRSDCKAPKLFLLPRLTDKKQTPDLLTRFWNHPLTIGLSPDKKLPSYLDPTTFAAVVVDLAVPGATTGALPGSVEGLERLLALASTCGEEPLRPLRRNMLTALQARRLCHPTQTFATPLEELRAGLEKWYNDAMARASGDYKRWAQGWLLGIGFVLTAALNADTIRAGYVLSTDNTLRSATATYAATIVAQPTNQLPQVVELVVTNEIALAQLRTNLVGQLREFQKLQQLGFPVGWKGGDKQQQQLNFVPYENCGNWKWLLKLLGWAVTAVAISFGAPFWYDLLSKLVNLRGSGKIIPAPESAAPPKTSSSENRGPAVASANSAPPAVGPVLPPTEALPHLGDARAGFDVRKAYWLAEASRLAYSAEPAVRGTVQQWGLELTRFFDFPTAEACQGFLAISQDKKIALLAFRGTEKKLEDWQTDAAFKLVPSPTGTGQTHEGFTQQLDTKVTTEKLYQIIVAELKNQLQPDTLLYLTGHSLGAALATLTAARLATDKVAGIGSVYTYGSPRVGDTVFARQYELALGHCTYRVVNAEDLVTRVPPRATPGVTGEYAHVGQTVYFDSDGRMQLNIAFWERFLNTVIKAVQDFRAQLKSLLKDHAMEEYVRLLKQQIPPRQ